MMYIIAGNINGLDEIKAFYDGAIRLQCPVMIGILLERCILLFLQDIAVNMHSFMFTDRNTGEGKISLRVNHTINYTNPDDLINAMNEHDHIIGIPVNKWNTGFDFLCMKLHEDNVTVDMSFYQVTVAKSHKYSMKAMNAILDAFRESGQFTLFVVMIFFVNHSRGKSTS